MWSKHFTEHWIYNHMHWHIVPGKVTDHKVVIIKWLQTNTVWLLIWTYMNDNVKNDTNLSVLRSSWAVRTGGSYRTRAPSSNGSCRAFLTPARLSPRARRPNGPDQNKHKPCINQFSPLKKSITIVIHYASVYLYNFGLEPWMVSIRSCGWKLPVREMTDTSSSICIQTSWHTHSHSSSLLFSKKCHRNVREITNVGEICENCTEIAWIRIELFCF